MSLEPRSEAAWISDILADQETLRKLVKELRRTHPTADDRPSYKAMNAVVEAESPNRFSDFMSGKTKRLSESEVGKCVMHLAAKYPEVSGRNGEVVSFDRLVEVALRLNEYLCVAPSSLALLKGRLEGYYWVFRPSIVAPGLYLRGLVAIWWVMDPSRAGELEGKNGMLRVCELHRSPAVIGNNAVPELMEVFDGFAISKQSVLFQFMSERYQHDDRGPLLIARFHSFVPSDPRRPLQIASGRVQGPADAGHAPPTVLLRIETAAKPMDLRYILDPEKTIDKAAHDNPQLQAVRALIDQCRICDQEGVPDLVLGRLAAMYQESLSWAERLAKLKADEE